jgi:uncharacterized protein YqeY
MSLKERIDGDLKQAMRDRDSGTVEALRMLRAAIQRREVDERISLDEDQVLAVIEKLIKQGRDAVEQFAKGGRQDLIDKENAQIEVLQTYLPEQLDEAELDALIEEAISSSGASTMKDMGKVMGLLKPKVQGRADMGAVSARIKARLSA